MYLTPNCYSRDRNYVLCSYSLTEVVKEVVSHMTCEACSKNANHMSAWVVTAMFTLYIYLDMILAQARPPRCLSLSRMRGVYPWPKPDLEIQGMPAETAGGVPSL